MRIFRLGSLDGAHRGSGELLKIRIRPGIGPVDCRVLEQALRAAARAQLIFRGSRRKAPECVQENFFACAELHPSSKPVYDRCCRLASACGRVLRRAQRNKLQEQGMIRSGNVLDFVSTTAEILKYTGIAAAGWVAWIADGASTSGISRWIHLRHESRTARRDIYKELAWNIRLIMMDNWLAHHATAASDIRTEAYERAKASGIINEIR